MSSLFVDCVAELTDVLLRKSRTLRARNDEGRFGLAMTTSTTILIYIPYQAGSKAKLGQDGIFFEHE